MRKIKGLFSRWLCMLLVGALVWPMGAMVTGCGEQPKDEKPHVVCTVFPVYDWVKNLTGELADVTLLADNGTDLHSYQPSVSDLVEIAECDLLIFVGGASDLWLYDALQNEGNPARKTLRLLDALGDAVLTETNAGILSPKQKHGHEHAQDAHTEPHAACAEDFLDADEHVWLSLQNARVLCEAITAELCELDAAHAAAYTEAQNAYDAQLAALDAAFLQTVQNATKSVVLVADRFPFLYLAKDYHLQYIAAFSGCSAEAELSPATVIALAAELDEMQLDTVLILDGSTPVFAQTVMNASHQTHCRILRLYAMQSVTRKQLAAHMTYVSCMEANRAVLEQALA